MFKKGGLLNASGLAASFSTVPAEFFDRKQQIFDVKVFDALGKLKKTISGTSLLEKYRKDCDKELHELPSMLFRKSIK